MTTSSRIKVSDVFHELRFTSSRSSGPGGQNVNKVNSRVSLRWDVAHSRVLTDEQRSTLTRSMGRFISLDGVLMLQAQESRSQHQNKEAVLQKLDELLRKAFTKERPRKRTRPTTASKEKRIDRKKRLSDKKQWRKKIS
ncbi:MAG: alternative ribosome rescue aminoacyl-tRNA hydrolase ArfB [Cyclobacteriaceae bacterium]